jgi:hypothetical protein
MGRPPSLNLTGCCTNIDRSRYYSGDRRFIVKQITETEKEVMLEILDDYIAHMKASRQRTDEGMGPVRSLLLRIVQLNRIQMYQHEVCGKTVMQGRLYFVVTENCFHQPLLAEVELMKAYPQHQDKDDAELMRIAEKEDLEVYDLKGSWVGRSTATDSSGRKRDVAGKTQKDNDLQELLHLSQEDKRQLTDQINSDSSFLMRHDIMDYSLLLGVKKGISPVMSDEAQSATARDDDAAADGGGGGGGVGMGGGLSDPFIYHAAAAHHSQRYYVGVIDILQKWDGSKKRETCFKECFLGKDPDGLSSMEPEGYQQRFARAMADHISAGPAQDIASQDRRSRAVSSLMTQSMRHMHMLDTSAEPGVASPRQAGGGGGGGARRSGREMTMIGGSE